MNKPAGKLRKAIKSNLPTATYDVGYGKPPSANRFPKGTSGNPKGRPKGARNRFPALNEERMKAIIMEEAYRMITVRDGDRNITIPMAQAIIRSLSINAAKGNQRAQRLFSELLAATETSNKQLHDEYLETSIIYKVEWERELQRRDKLGVTGPEPIPHPDHIEIDFDTGAVRIKGPMTKEEKEFLDKLRPRKEAIAAELKELQQELIDDPNCQHRQFIEDDIAHLTRMLTILKNIKEV